MLSSFIGFLLKVHIIYEKMATRNPQSPYRSLLRESRYGFIAANSRLMAQHSTVIACIEADYQRSADTHLIALPLPGFAARGVDLYLKDESNPPPHRQPEPSAGTLAVFVRTVQRYDS